MKINYFSWFKEGRNKTLDAWGQSANPKFET